MGLKIDRCDNRCALCREAEADKTGSHLAPNFMIHGMFSFDGKGRRNREISMRDHLNTSERMVYYGPEVSPDAINADHGGDLTDEELEENVNNLVCDHLFCNTCENRFEILETYYSTYYADWKHEEVNSINTYDCDGEVVNEISLEEFALLKRFVIDEAERYGWGPAQEEVKLNLREKDRTAGVLHSVGYNEERELLRVARMEDEAKPRPVFLRNSYRFYAAELKEYACKQEGKEYDVLKDRSLFLFQFDIDNYRNDLKRYVREGEDISGLPYVDKLFDKKYWEGKEGYQKKLEFLEETYRDLKEKGYTFEDFMNNLRSRMGG